MTTSFDTSPDQTARVIFTTCDTIELAQKISQTLIREKLAACVNRIGPVQSTYEWEGKIEDSQEFLLMIKTTPEAASSVMERIQALHTYSVPELIAFPVVAASSSYLNWIRQSVHL